MTQNPAITTKVISFRIGDGAFASLDAVAKAHGVAPAAYARKIVLDAIAASEDAPKVRRRVLHAEEFRRLLAELGRQGGNLNQVAKHLNAGGRASDIHELVTRLSDEHAAALRAITRILVAGGE